MYTFVWRRVMEKFFKQYFGEHYTMAIFYQDTMVSGLWQEFFGYHDAVILDTGALMGWV